MQTPLEPGPLASALVLGHGSLSFVNLDVHRSLIVLVRREDLRFLMKGAHHLALLHSLNPCS